MKTKEENLREICKFIILNLSSKRLIDSSYTFRNIFTNSLGILIDESVIIQDLIENNLLKSEGIIDNSPFYKFVSCTEKGKKYYDDNLHTVNILEDDFPKEKLDLVKIFLGLKRPEF
ncbi:MAG: hypothetical protein Q4C98_08110 [Capnocytophaga sp.]|nr:hypothetical protein [Capnocytophaga sp.]